METNTDPTIMGVSVDVDGLAEPFQADRSDLLHQLYESIGCTMVEAVHLSGFTVWVDEEGLLGDEPVYNPSVSMFVSRRLGVLTPLAGNAVITGGVDDEGNALGLSRTSIELLVRAFEMVSRA